jgi:hypothetical protein
VTSPLLGDSSVLTEAELEACWNASYMPPRGETYQLPRRVDRTEVGAQLAAYFRSKGQVVDAIRWLPFDRVRVAWHM